MPFYQKLKSVVGAGKFRLAPITASHKFSDLPPLQIVNFQPFGNGQANSINFNYVVVPSISSLLYGCSPSAVIRVIGAIVILAFNRMVGRRLFSHISKEVVERLSPSLANYNAASSVNREFVVLWVMASLFYFNPSIMLWSMALIMLNSDVICLKEGGCRFFGQASATKRVLTEICRRYFGCFTAVAKTRPKSISSAFDRRDASHYKQSPKTFSFQIQPSHFHSPITTMNGYSGIWGTVNV